MIQYSSTSIYNKYSSRNMLCCTRMMHDVIVVHVFSNVRRFVLNVRREQDAGTYFVIQIPGTRVYVYSKHNTDSNSQFVQQYSALQQYSSSTLTPQVGGLHTPTCRIPVWYDMKYDVKNRRNRED